MDADIGGVQTDLVFIDGDHGWPALRDLAICLAQAFLFDADFLANKPWNPAALFRDLQRRFLAVPDVNSKRFSTSANISASRIQTAM